MGFFLRHTLACCKAIISSIPIFFFFPQHFCSQLYYAEDARSFVHHCGSILAFHLKRANCCLLVEPIEAVMKAQKRSLEESECEGFQETSLEKQLNYNHRNEKQNHSSDRSSCVLNCVSLFLIVQEFE